MELHQKYLFKILLVGDISVGKSSIMQRYCDSKATIGIDYKIKHIKLDNNYKICIQIWDTAGQERYRTIVSNYYRNIDCIMLCFDISDVNSFFEIKNLYEQAKKFAKESTIFLLTSTKIDKQFMISTNQINEFIEKNCMQFFAVSSKYSIGINEMFNTIIKKLVKHKSLNKEKEIEPIKLEKTNKIIHKSCNC